MIELGSIAKIRSGVTLRGRDAKRSDPAGSCRMIRIADLSDDGELTAAEFHRFEPAESIRPDHFLKPGDVLFPNRGTRNTALAFTLPDTNLIVGAQFFVIQPDPARLDPAYLSWCLRSEPAARYFHTCRRGTLVQTLQKSSLRHFLLPLPPLPTQHRIVEIDRLALHERKLSEALQRKQRLLLQTSLHRFADQHSA